MLNPFKNGSYWLVSQKRPRYIFYLHSKGNSDLWFFFKTKLFWSLKFILSKCTPSTVAYRTYMSSQNACSAFCHSYNYISRGFIFHLKLSYSPAYFRFCKTTYSQNAFLSDLKTKTANFKIGVGFVSRSVQNVRRRRRFITICHKTRHKFYLKILIAKIFRGWILE